MANTENSTDTMDMVKDAMLVFAKSIVPWSFSDVHEAIKELYPAVTKADIIRAVGVDMRHPATKVCGETGRVHAVRFSQWKGYRVAISGDPTKGKGRGEIRFAPLREYIQCKPEHHKPIYIADNSECCIDGVDLIGNAYRYRKHSARRIRVHHPILPSVEELDAFAKAANIVGHKGDRKNGNDLHTALVNCKCAYKKAGFVPRYYKARTIKVRNQDGTTTTKRLKGGYLRNPLGNIIKEEGVVRCIIRNIYAYLRHLSEGFYKAVQAAKVAKEEMERARAIAAMNKALADIDFNFGWGVNGGTGNERTQAAETPILAHSYSSR